MVSVLRAAVLVMGVARAALAQELYRGLERPLPVVQRDAEWRDESRHRDVPVRIYQPKIEKEEPARPMVVFSHGMGASRRSYGYICEHLAAQGFVVVVPTHEGSDTAGVRKELGDRLKRQVKGEQPRQGLIAENTNDPENLRNRPKDISFVIDRALKDPELRIDAARIGVAGHSFGAYTAMAEGGMLVDLPEGKDQNLRDARVKAVLPMSPEGHGVMGIDEGAWDQFAAPVLFLTGTKDYGQGERSAAWRREAFDAIRKKERPTEAYLMVLNGATHMTFGGGDRLSSDRTHRQDLIKALATAWFDAELKGDVKARQWLEAFAAAKHEDCTAERAQGRK